MGQLRSIAVAAIALVLYGAAAAEARERVVPDVDAPVGDVELVDTVIGAAPARAAALGATGGVYSTFDGHEVEVLASRAYARDPLADQRIVDFLATRLHGPELSSLSVYVGTPAEIARICGSSWAVACYAVDEQRMYVPGERVHGVPIEYALTHEYGHHVAGWRSNNPWSALDWGPKHWSSEMQVCAHVDAGRLFPGNQGRYYLRDPGEGFADGYAHVHYPRAAWQYAPLLKPDRRALRAIRRDVLHPWTGPRSRTFRGRLRRKRPASFRFRLTLDGDVTVQLAARPGARAAVEISTTAAAAGHTLRAGGSFGVEWCRRKPMEVATVTVRRHAGGGPFSLRLSWPG